MRGLFSFAVAILVALVLCYFATSAMSISEYHASGQKRLQMQVIFQAYNQTDAIYDEAVIDAALDSAYASSAAAGCNPAASGSLANALQARVQNYVSAASANLTGAFDSTAVAEAGWTGTSLSTQSKADETLVPSCSAGLSLVMRSTTTTVAFPFNVTSTDKRNGAFFRPFSKSYDILTNYSASNRSFTVLVRRDGAALRCINVAC